MARTLLAQHAPRRCACVRCCKPPGADPAMVSTASTLLALRVQPGRMRNYHGRLPHRHTPSSRNPMPCFPSLRRTALLALSALLCVLAIPATPALAQEVYPSRPVSIVVGYPPGGSVDLVARTLAVELGHRLRAPMVVENIGGARGALRPHSVGSAAPDGYTLLVGSINELVINKLVTRVVKSDLKDFSAIGHIVSQPLVLVASPGVGVQNLAEFTQKVARNPGKFSYGSSGVGTSLHLAGEMIKEQGRLFMTHIPYRGVAPLASDLLGNNLEFGMFALSSGLPYIKSGKLIALGTTEASRSAITPDIPALAESPQ